MWNITVTDAHTVAIVQDAVEKLLTNTIPHISLSDNLTVTVNRQPDHLLVTWEGRVEGVLNRLIKPDFVQARVYKEYAELDARISGLRIRYAK